jgi:hypothetical protein
MAVPLVSQPVEPNIFAVREIDRWSQCCSFGEWAEDALDFTGVALVPAAHFSLDGKVRLGSQVGGKCCSVHEPGLRVGAAACFEWFRFITDSMAGVGWGQVCIDDNRLCDFD